MKELPTIDFTSKKLLYRVSKRANYSQHIARATHITPRIKPKILDVTAGLGKDAFIFASLGCEVTMIEKNRTIAELLKDAIMQGLEHKMVHTILNRMTLIHGDALDYFVNLKQKPDIIYIDPMFPERTKSALVKKEMQILQKLIPSNEAGDEKLLANALDQAKKRVVVKRPRLAAPIKGKAPSFQLKGKTTRYDVYLTNLSAISNIPNV